MTRVMFKKSNLIRAWWVRCLEEKSQVCYILPDKRDEYRRDGLVVPFKGDNSSPAAPGWFERVVVDVLYEAWRTWAEMYCPWYVDDVTKRGFMIMFVEVAANRIERKSTMLVDGKRTATVNFKPMENTHERNNAESTPPNTEASAEVS